MSSVAAERRTRPVVERVRARVEPDRRLSPVAAEDRTARVTLTARVTSVRPELRGPSARVGSGIFGVAASITWTAVPGEVFGGANTTVVGVVAGWSVTALPGSVAVGEEIHGPPAAFTVSAVAGSVAVTRNTSTAGVSAGFFVAAFPGGVLAAVNTTVAGASAAVAVAAHAGGAEAVRNLAVAGVAAAVDLAAVAGTVAAARNTTVGGVSAGVSVTAHAGVVEFSVPANVAGVVADVAVAAVAGTVVAAQNVTVAGVTVGASVSAHAGSVSTVRNATVAATSAGVTVQAHAGVVLPSINTTAAGVSGTVYVAAPAGTVDAVLNLVRQRINKNGNQVIPQNTRTALTDWTSDGTYPATINAHRLQVSGAGNVTVTWATSRISSTGFGSAMDCYLMRNGVQIDSFTMAIGVTSGSDTWTGTVADGDTFHIEVQSSVSVQNHRTITASGTYIDVNPT